MALKKDLRRIYKLARKALNSQEKLKREAQVFEKLRNNFKLENKHVHTFLPIQRLQEIDTSPLLQSTDSNWILSQSNFQDNSMRHLAYEPSMEIRNNAWDIPEPVEGRPIDPKHIDVVLVPLLCFDLRGYRVGYGKGFYDRFLAELKEDCQIIGLSLFDPVTKISDVNQHDQTMHAVVTPDIIYYF